MKRVLPTVAATAALGLLAASSAQAVPTIAFEPAVFHPTGETGSASLDSNGTAVLDIDGDGHDDVAMVAPWMSSTLIVMYGDGSGSFAAPQSISVGDVNNNVIPGDFDGDGDPDLAVTGMSAFTVLVNEGGRTFDQGATYTLWQTPFQAAGTARDFDNDGDLDLALKAVNGIQMMLGVGNGSFTFGPLTSLPGSFPGAITALDDANLNGDNRVDLVVTDASTQRVHALVGTGGGTFSVRSSKWVPLAPSTVKAGDLNGSGTDSVVVLPEASPPNASVAVLINDGTGKLGAPTSYNGGFGNPNGLVDDLNGDGTLDIVSMNTFSGDLVTLAGNGDGTFIAAGTFATSMNGQTPATGDFDEDGRRDLAVPTRCPGTATNEICLATLTNVS